MSETSLAAERRRQWLPAWLRPREAEPRRGGRLWAIETTLLVLAGVFLAVATVNDLGREVDINHRLVADLATWRDYTHHDYVNISIDQETLGLDSGREVLCGNTRPGAPGSKTQICLAIWGAVVDGRRSVHGGWYLPPYHPDAPANRYGCFGPAGHGKCPR
ncbi:MAG TPA: hypothetical protein VMF09_10720 [Solirubrobacteraceae bacterium]|nr:hypothetical protein [Solirubrobacteraceae bacterium]